MPIYSFACSSCGFRMEEFYHVTEKQPTQCPNCQEQTLQQELGMPSRWFPAAGVFNGNWTWVEKRTERETRHSSKDKA